MFSSFICGSFHHQREEEEDDGSYVVPSSTPKKAIRSSSFCKRNKKNKNPYSTRGLDKFSTLLADLQARRQKIYAQMGSQDMTSVRFVYSNTNGNWVPIVVKMKDPKQEKPKVVGGEDSPLTQKSEALVVSSLPDKPSAASDDVCVQTPEQLAEATTKKCSSSWSIDKWSRPSQYLPMVIILILLCLVMFGRSFAIICTSLLWYLVPTATNDRDWNLMRRSFKKKEYVRRLSENKIMNSGGLSSPTTPRANNLGSGATRESPPRKHRTGKGC
ncbi:PREDICTED: uncharacterized protein LOC104609715 [Nelumbo nucifera]|uniref:ZCF37 n=2 Tax=Nelumbo nucifera TaxID=4432 RepID=A0A822XIF2_NELNU|nr:PREDICTED: uncharacterized protein LOC104609715 [Nelumbo nucifera]DAD21304.1 TPA_asm: hypothetical protein HUJ06_022767 [Nelumbo nucifera]